MATSTIDAEAAEHRDGVHQDAARALVLLDLGRRLEHDLPGGQLGLVEPSAPKRRAQASPRGRWSAAMIGGPEPSDYPADDGRNGRSSGASEGDDSGGRVGAASSLAVSVHGPAGVLDLLVPPAATAVDVAREYAAAVGPRLDPAALHPPRRAPPARRQPGLGRRGRGGPPGGARRCPDPVVVRRPGPSPHSCSARPRLRPVVRGAAAVAALAGWFAAHADSSTRAERDRRPAPARGAARGAPVGRYAPHRALAAPAFGAAAAFAVVWDPDLDRLPMVVGITALAGAVAAAVARARTTSRGGPAGLDDRRRRRVPGHRSAGLLGLPRPWPGPCCSWAAMFAARVVPGFAIDVPDQLLIDLERLAVTAWSARDRPRGRRGRAVASPTPWPWSPRAGHDS